MGQQNCCQITKKQANSITQNDIENLSFDKLDFNRGSTYKKLESIATEITTTKNISSAYNILISRIIANKQEHLLKVLKDIDTKEKQQQFIAHLETLDFELVDSLFYNICKQKNNEDDDEDMSYKPNYYYQKCTNIEDIQEIEENRYEKYFKTGLQMIKNKEVGIILLAGGKNMRFHDTDNKGLCDLGLPSGKSMTQIIAERIVRLNQLASSGEDKTNSQVQLYIMTNDENFLEIKHYWKNNKFFGIDPNCITFFLQQTLPVVNSQGQVILKNNFKVHLAPNGPADFFPQLLTHQIFKKILKQNIKFLHVIGVDNLLIKPLDPFFLGYAKYQNKDFVCKVAQKSTIDDDCQLFINKIDKNPQNQSFNTNQDISYNGSQIANFNSIQNAKSLTAVMTNHELLSEIENNPQQCQSNILDSPIFMQNCIINMQFLNNIAGDPQKKFQLAQKFHVVKRTLDFYDPYEQKILKGQQNNSYCFEKEIGDMIVLTDSSNVALLKVNREEEYSPIVYDKGVYSKYDAKINMSNLHKKWLGMENRNSLESEIVEISPKVSYNGEQLDHIIVLIEKWQNIEYPLYIKSHAQLVELTVQSQNQQKIQQKQRQLSQTSQQLNQINQNNQNQQQQQELQQQQQQYQQQKQQQPQKQQSYVLKKQQQQQ